MGDFNKAVRASGQDAEYRDAIRRAQELDLRCRCSAWNRPGAILIHLAEDGIACCDQCGRAWEPEELRR